MPEFRVSYTITTDKFDALYKKLKPKGVTLTALLAKACGVALASHPLLYACALSPCSLQHTPKGMADLFDHLNLASAALTATGHRLRIEVLPLWWL